MVVDGVKTFGILQLEGPRLDEEDARFVSVVANQLAVALRRSEAEAERGRRSGAGRHPDVRRPGGPEQAIDVYRRSNDARHVARLGGTHGPATARKQ
jgi:hypothetical protein